MSERNSKQPLVYLFIKRFFDIVISFMVSLVILVPCLIIALLIIIVDPGTPFYYQERIGKNGKKIKVLKFRSMKKNADEIEKTLTPEQLEQYQREYKIDNDPRLIGKHFGSFIRKSSLDELPQIIVNILLLGNMSIVGPRPILSDELSKKYTKEEQAKLVSIKPGLTGYWQAYARNNATYETGERQKMELYYVDNASFWMDIKIMFKTVISVLKTDGAK